MTVPVPSPTNALHAYNVLPLPKDFIQPAKIPGTQQILWIGCSDSTVAETDVLDVSRGEIFVYRNLGGRVSAGDMSSSAAIEWGIGLLKVKYIVICGHYDCALRGRETGPSTSNSEREKRILEEQHVLAESRWLSIQESVRRAVEEEGVEIHALVYDREKGSAVRLVEGSAK